MEFDEDEFCIHFISRQVSLFAPTFTMLIINLLMGYSYQIFLSSIIGVIIGDYFFVRKGKYDVNAMFSREKHAPYYYTKGWNWRAYAAYVIGIIPVFPGFLSSVGLKGVPIGAQRLYVFALPIGIIVSMLTYWGLSVWKPPMGTPVAQWSEPELYNGSDGSSIDEYEAKEKV
jgi:cytosine/uracil/thiamine/allantoin permease